MADSIIIFNNNIAITIIMFISKSKYKFSSHYKKHFNTTLGILRENVCCTSLISVTDAVSTMVIHRKGRDLSQKNRHQKCLRASLFSRERAFGI